MFFDRPRRRFSRPAQTRRVPLSVEALESRLTPYGASSNAWAHPELVTLSFVPDGTVVGSNAGGNIYSNLQSTFDNHANANLRANWRREILRAAQSWAQQTNINFALVGDNGASIGSGAFQQGDPEMGDIRVGGWHMGATAQLGQAYAPPPVNNYSVAGDIQFNMSRNWNVGTTYDLYTVALHEIGHASGLYHANGTAGGSTAAVMWSTYQGTRAGPSADDINGARSKYSAGQARSHDYFDAAAPNDAFASTTALDGWVNAADLTALVPDLDITTTADTDYYSFYAPADTTGPLTITVQSQGLSLLAPQVAVYAADQTTLLGYASAPDQYGATVSVTLSGVNPNDQLYVVVDGADNTAFGTGKYGLTLALGAAPAPGVAPPNTQTANGNPLSSGGGQAYQYNTEFRVNTTTSGYQITQSESGKAVAMDANGNYVVVWSSYGQDGDGNGVYAQRYQTNGAAVGSEFRVNTTTAGEQQEAAVAMDAAGNFVVTWSSYNVATGWDVYAQRYSAAGVAQGGQFRVNSSTSYDADYSSVAMDAAGNFVVIWSSYGQDGDGYGVYARRYNAAGTALAGAFRVANTTAGDQDYSVAAMSANGFVVTWSSYNLTTGWDVYARRYNAVGTALGNEFRVNTVTADSQQYSSVAMDSAGNFGVTWSSYGQDGSGWGAYVRRYDANGVALGSEFRASTTTAGDQFDPSVVMDDDGNFLVAWTDGGSDGDWSGVFAQQYNMAGANIGTEFRVNTTTAGDQQSASMAMNTAGHLIVVWSGNGPGDADGVFGQMYMVNAGNGLSNMEAQADPYSEFAHDHSGHDHDHGGGCDGSLCQQAAWGTPAAPSAFGSAADPVSGLVGTEEDRTTYWMLLLNSLAGGDGSRETAPPLALDWWGTKEWAEQESQADDLAAWRGGTDNALGESSWAADPAAVPPVE